MSALPGRRCCPQARSSDLQRTALFYFAAIVGEGGRPSKGVRVEVQ